MFLTICLTNCLVNFYVKDTLVSTRNLWWKILSRERRVLHVELSAEEAIDNDDVEMMLPAFLSKRPNYDND